MGLELCGRRDNGSIWGPAVLPCNETLNYKYRVRDIQQEIQKGRGSIWDRQFCDAMQSVSRIQIQKSRKTEVMYVDLGQSQSTQ